MTAMQGRRSSRMLWLLLAGIGSFLLLIAAGLAYNGYMSDRYKRDGVRTEATVTEVTVEHHKERRTVAHGAGRRRYITRHAPYTETTIRYEYEVDGVCYEGRASTRKTQPKRVKQGERIPVEYLSGKPSQSRVISCPRFQK